MFFRERERALENTKRHAYYYERGVNTGIGRPSSPTKHGPSSPTKHGLPSKDRGKSFGSLEAGGEDAIRLDGSATQGKGSSLVADRHVELEKELEQKSDWRRRYEAAKVRIEKEKEEGWHEINSGLKKNTRSDGRGLGRRFMQGENLGKNDRTLKKVGGKEVRFADLVTIFVDGLRPMIDASWLRFIFKGFGKVMDSFIPVKKREGAPFRFGFIRFRKRIEAMEAIKHLNGTRRHGFNLIVKLANYGWNSDRVSGDAKLNGNGEIKKIWTLKKEGRSYKDAVLNTGESSIKQSKGVEDITQKKEEKVIQVSLENIEKNWLGRCLIGRLPNVTAVEGIGEVLKGEGVLSVEVKRMGGTFVLLICQDREEAVAFMADGANWLKNWFVEVDFWTQEFKNTVRFAWLSCVGVPIHAWDSNTFRKIAGVWGDFVDMDECTRSESSYDRGRVLISTQYPKIISEVITVKVQELCYDVRVMEEGAGDRGGRTLMHPPLVSSGSEDNVFPVENEMMETVATPENRNLTARIPTMLEVDEKSIGVNESLLQEEREDDGGGDTRVESCEIEEMAAGGGEVRNSRKAVPVTLNERNKGEVCLNQGELDSGLRGAKSSNGLGLDGEGFLDNGLLDKGGDVGRKEVSLRDMDQNSATDHGQDDLPREDSRYSKMVTSDPISDGSVWPRTIGDTPLMEGGGLSNSRKGRNVDDDLGLENQRMGSRRRAKRKKSIANEFLGPLKKMGRIKAVGNSKKDKQRKHSSVEGVSISDGDIRNRNMVLRKEAGAIIDLGIECGVSVRGNEEEVMSKLMEMEGLDNGIWEDVRNKSKC